MMGDELFDDDFDFDEEYEEDEAPIEDTPGEDFDIILSESNVDSIKPLPDEFKRRGVIKMVTLNNKGKRVLFK